MQAPTGPNFSSRLGVSRARPRFSKCSGAIDRACLPYNCKPGDVPKLLPRLVATGLFAPIAVTSARKVGERNLPAHRAAVCYHPDKQVRMG